MSCMNHNHNNETANKNVCIAIEKGKTESNTGHISLEIDELQVKGVVLKGLHANLHTEFTDTYNKVQCDTGMELVRALLNQFGDALVDSINANTENTRARKAYYEAEVKTEEERAKREKAETAYYEAKEKEVEARMKQYENAGTKAE